MMVNELAKNGELRSREKGGREEGNGDDVAIVANKLVKNDRLKRNGNGIS